MTSTISSSIACHIHEQLQDRNERLVLAESCTGGAVAAEMTKIPGASECFCGSLVTYRPSCKQDWLDVSQDTINAHTTESPEVVCEMAKGALKHCSEATWSAAVVGHFSSNPHMLFIAIARRTRKGKIKCKEAISYQIKTFDRDNQQKEATQIVLTMLNSVIVERVEKELL